MSHATLPTIDAPRRLDLRFAIGLTLVFALTLLPRILLHAFWRDEWHVWLVASDGCSLSTLLSRVRYDGHPVTWYVLLWLGSHVWNDVTVVRLIHLGIASAAAFLVAGCAPFSRVQRAMLVFGYFFVFEYAVISRNYSLGAVLLLLTAAVALRRPRSYVLIGTLLALSMQTNAFASLVALAIAGWLGLRWLMDGRPAVRRFVIGAAIICLGVALAAWQSTGPADRVNTPWTFDFNPMRAGKMLAAPWRSLVPIPDIGRHWWSTNILDATLGVRVLMPTQSLLGIAIVLAVAWAIPPSRRDLRLLWLGGVALILGFGYVKLTGSLRHHGHLFLLLVVVWWLAANAPESLDRGRRRFWIGLLFVHLLAGAIASVADLARPFSAAPATAAFIRDRFPGAAIIGQRDIDATCIAGELGRRVFFPTPGRWGTFIIWNNQRSTFASTARLTEVGEELHRQQPDRAVLLVLSAESSEPPEEARFEEVARFDDATVDSERFAVFRFRAPATGD